MKTIERLFKEVKMEILKVAFLNSFLNACIGFFAMYLVMILFDISFIYAIIFSLMLFVANFVYTKSQVTLKSMEDANPQIKEMLRTAYDNQDEKNVIVLGLFYEVVKKMKTVSSGNMLDSNLLFKKVLAITILAFIVVFASSLEIYLGNINIPLGELAGFGGIFQGEGNPGDRKNTTLDVIGFNETSGLFGEQSLAKLGKEQLDLNINPSISELDFDREKGLEDKKFSRDDFPVEPVVKSSDFGGNDIPEEAELAKAYNLELKK